jgi:hypothetical protein
VRLSDSVRLRGNIENDDAPQAKVTLPFSCYRIMGL